MSNWHRNLAFIGVVLVVTSLAFAANVSRSCGGGSACPGTVVCEQKVAWCCCKNAAGTYVCTCSTGSVCGDGNVPPGFVLCVDP